MKNKLLITLCLFTLINFSFINFNVFAAGYEQYNMCYDLIPIHSDGDRYVPYILYTGGGSINLIYCKSINASNLYFTGSRLYCDTGKMSKYIYNNNTASFEFNSTLSDFYISPSLYSIVASNIDIYKDGSLFFRAKPVDPYIESLLININPSISNTEENLSSGIFDYILVNPGTFSNTEEIGFGIYKNTDEDSDIYSINPVFSTMLVKESRYYKSLTVDNITEFWYEIPRANLDINFKNGDTYTFVLLLDGSPIQEIQVTIGGLTEEDILNNNFDNLQSSILDSNKELQDTITESNKEVQDSIDKQTLAIEENNKTNKNIFEKIGEILSYLNPFSENFFAYKLVELIVNGLKSLFIPADNFFSLYFDNLNNWFSDRLGFLYYPIELLFNLLDRFLNINFAEPVINIPNIREPFTNVILIKTTSFNFNDLLENETLKNVHDIYFIIVDAFIYIGLVGLLYRKYEEVMTK